ncbi:MAG: hypothetical protein A2V57_08080 [Candidatus Aminicenantes bacterium RBG_19FT_COMBO_65_30]|nr:MAG: hypothetical protein A2V57_08080 [Candidatus Aminicenantes bacterium RBG_19FT_COMBO_65_30]
MTGKTIALKIAAVMLLASAAAPPAWAQYRENRLDTRPLTLYIDLGYVNLNSQPKWMTLGPELEVRLGRLISVNPELSIWFNQSFRGNVNVVPGATVNLRLGRFLVGGGAVRKVSPWAEDASGWLVPKVQVGYLTGPSRLTLSLMYLNQTNHVVLGMTIGVGIGRRPREPEG